MQPSIDNLNSAERPNPPQGGSGVIKAPVRIEFGEEFNAIIGNLTYIEVIINRILENVKNVQKQLGNANIEFRLNFNDTYIDNAAVKKFLIGAVNNGDIQFFFELN